MNCFHISVFELDGLEAGSFPELPESKSMKKNDADSNFEIR